MPLRPVSYFYFLKFKGPRYAYSDNGSFAFKIPMFEKEYRMKTVMFTEELTLPGRTNMLNLQCHLIFDSLGTLNLVTTGHESSKSVYFTDFSG